MNKYQKDHCRLDPYLSIAHTLSEAQSTPSGTMFALCFVPVTQGITVRASQTYTAYTLGCHVF